MQTLVEQQLDKLEKDGVIEPVQHSEWAAPIVPVLKSDKSVRICGDFKQTVNQASRLDKYPIPRIEDLFAKLAGGQRFTKLDMSQAYQQLELDEDSKQYSGPSFKSRILLLLPFVCVLFIFPLLQELQTLNLLEL